MKGKMKTLGIPLLLMTLFFGGVIIHQMMSMKQLPQPNWSRSLPMDLKLEDRPQYFSIDKELFTNSEGKVKHYTISKDLKLQEKSPINIKVKRGDDFWTNGSTSIYLKDGKLLVSKNKVTDVIASNVSDLSSGVNDVYFWSGNILYYCNPDNFSTTKIKEFQSDVLDVSINKEGQAVVKTQKNDTQSLLYYIDNSQKIIKNPFALVSNETNKKVEDIAFIENNKNLTVFYSEEMRSQGILSHKIFKLVTPINEIGNALIKPDEVIVTNENNGFKIANPQSVEFVKIDDKSMVLISGEGQKIGDNNTVSLYLSPFTDENVLKAGVITTTKEFALNPLVINNNSILWFNFDGHTNELYGASQNKDVILKSTKWNETNVKEAFYNGIVMIASSVITILTSFYWMIPSLFLLILLSFFQPNSFEREGINIWEYISIILFLMMPLTYISRSMNDYFYYVAPEYLTFSGSSYIILIVISIITAVIWKLGRDPEWGTFSGAFYFMIVYTLLFVSSVGSYFFNIF
ncbi:hypothetical protein JI667_18995 [Bacillus sp. NTK074B]|uniref:hypothetical protein n=1 Tax=Bacillus sp. NTK074B TaxID=2802174 RepID=UPI001A8C5814|nr:hypothetical protein [Bacillus sp. NTK074B]